MSHVVFLLLFLTKAHSFNVDTKNVILFENPQRDETQHFFGISSVIFRNRVYIGAPGANSKFGSVFLCSIKGDTVEGETRSNCHRLSGESENEEARLGASLLQVGLKTYVCAPLSTLSKYASYQATMGSCYVIQQEFVKHAFTLLNNQTYLWRSNKRSGWRTVSIMGHALESTSENELVIGIPTAKTQDFSWDTERLIGGIGVIRYYDHKDFFVPQPSSVSWANTLHASKEDPHTQDFTGMSISRGRFFNQIGDHFAVGSPKGNRMKGRVHICSRCLDPEKTELENDVFIDGEQIGSKFGQTVISIDLNGDEWDDLVIGAPLYCQSPSNYDTGAVFIIETVVINKKSFFNKLDKFPEHEIFDGAQFGAGLMNLGDLDGDGYEDFVVGAPYENNGAIYIYNGNSKMMITSYSQKISAEFTSIALKGFGYSFSRPMDVDGNGRSDFIIGAPHSEKAILLRSLQVLTIEPDSYLSGPKLIDPYLNQFNLSLCVRLQNKALYSTVISIVFHDVDSRVDSKSISLSENPIKLNKRNISKCISVILKAYLVHFGVIPDELEQFPEPIKVQASYSWKYDSSVICHPLGCPVISPLSKVNEVKSYSGQLESGCHQRTCQCQMELYSISPISFIPGVHKTLSLSFSVANRGKEPSFSTRILLKSLNDVELSSEEVTRCSVLVKSNLSEVFIRGRSFDCSLRGIGPLSSKDFVIKFTTENLLRAPTKDFLIELEILASCDVPALISKGSSLVTVTPQFQLSSLSSSLPYNDIDFNSEHKVFEHVHSLINLGPSPIPSPISFQINIPKNPILTFLDFNYNNNEMICNFKESSSGSPLRLSEPLVLSCDFDSCSLIHCEISSGWLPKKTIEMRIQFKFDPSLAVENQLESFQVFTSLVLKKKIGNEESYISSSASTSFYSLSAAKSRYYKNFLYPLIGGLLIGFILLCLLIGTLWKTGTLAKMRIYKTQLDEAEKEEKET